MGDWTYSPAAFVNLLHSFSPFRTNKAGCIRSHEGGSLAAHQAAGCPQENGEAAGEGRSVKCTSQLPHNHTDTHNYCFLSLPQIHTRHHTDILNVLQKKWQLKDVLEQAGKEEEREGYRWGEKRMKEKQIQIHFFCSFKERQIKASGERQWRVIRAKRGGELKERQSFFILEWHKSYVSEWAREEIFDPLNSCSNSTCDQWELGKKDALKITRLISPIERLELNLSILAKLRTMSSKKG